MSLAIGRLQCARCRYAVEANTTYNAIQKWNRLCRLVLEKKRLVDELAKIDKTLSLPLKHR